MVNSKDAYSKAIIDLRNLLVKIGRRDFRAYGYSKQLRAYRARVGSNGVQRRPQLAGSLFGARDNTMSKSSEVVELMDLANGGHPGVIMGGPIREGMSSTLVSSELHRLFDITARMSRKTNSQAVPADADLSAHKLVMGRTRDGMSRAFASMNKEPSSKVAGLLACLLRRI